MSTDDDLSLENRRLSGALRDLQNQYSKLDAQSQHYKSMFLKLDQKYEAIIEKYNSLYEKHQALKSRPSVTVPSVNDETVDSLVADLDTGDTMLQQLDADDSALNRSRETNFHDSALDVLVLVHTIVNSLYGRWQRKKSHHQDLKESYNALDSRYLSLKSGHDTLTPQYKTLKSASDQLASLYDALKF